MRSPVRWYGGKGNMVTKILPLIPNHHTYVEPFCGGASVFWNKQPSSVEVLNDLDTRVIQLYREIQDKEQLERLRWKAYHTPYALKSLEQSFKKEDIAWDLFVMKNFGFSGLDIKTSGRWG